MTTQFGARPVREVRRGFHATNPQQQQFEDLLRQIIGGLTGGSGGTAIFTTGPGGTGGGMPIFMNLHGHPGLLPGLRVLIESRIVQTEL